MKPFSVLGLLVSLLLVQPFSLDTATAGRVLWQLGDDDNDGGLFSSMTDNRLGRPLGDNNTLYDCSAATDILTIDYVHLNPDPPGRGQTLEITAKGTFSEAVTEGSYAKVVVKLGIIKLLTKTFDVCEEIKQANLTCPLGPGEMILKQSIDLPKEIPPVSHIPLLYIYIICLYLIIGFLSRKCQSIHFRG
jgi:hypothetical protein